MSQFRMRERDGLEPHEWTSEMDLPVACRSLFVLLAILACHSAIGAQKPGNHSPLPPAWLADWLSPPAEDRPREIIHGIDPAGKTPKTVGGRAAEDSLAQAALAKMRYYKDLGLGGVVCNVSFQQYLESDDAWQALVRAVKACKELGLIVWLYDENGYPSGAAGGLVLRENRKFEASELVYDRSGPNPFALRPAFEHTHASNNYCAVRRYINLIDPRAVQCFLEKTHEAYWRRLEPFFGGTIQATFTDEPSLIALNLGQLPESVRKGVPVVDPIDPAVRPLPAVPWCRDLPQLYRQRYGEDLMPQRRSLFAGDQPEDRTIRRQFWALIAELIADRYFGALETWCAGHHIASSGHSLWEENLLHHVPIEGNGLKVLGRMQIPGLDELSSDPEAVIYDGWMTACLPTSAALLADRRQVMTEVSDFCQTMAGRGPVALAEMQATAAWQAAWGVTEFNLYYGISGRSADDFHAYCDCVGRLNAILRRAQPVREVLLYYPIYDLWGEYLPVAEPLQVSSQSPRAQRIVASFMQLGQLLQRSQIPVTLIDHERLAAAHVAAGGKLVIGKHAYSAIVLPESVELPAAAAGVVQSFRQQGGTVLIDRPDAGRLSAATLRDALRPVSRIVPSSDRIALGRFIRDGRRIELVVNVAATPYEGRIGLGLAGTWQVLDPATGTIQSVDLPASGELPLSLKPRQAVIIVQ